MNLLTKDGLQHLADRINNNRILYAKCETAAATRIKEVVLEDSNKEVKDGDLVYVFFAYTNTFNSVADNPVKLKIGDTEFQPFANETNRKNKAIPTGTNAWYNGQANQWVIYKVYKSTKELVFIDHSYDQTYSNQSLGNGWGTCTTAASTTAKVVSLGSYALTTHGRISVKFTNAVPANATMNVNSKGAKNIFYRGSKITAGIIGAGDIATFVYDGTQYQLISIDKPTYTKTEVDTLISNLRKELKVTYYS